jgi:hypothetical protein
MVYESVQVGKSGIDPEHASLQAYPDATLSAQDTDGSIVVRVESDGRHVIAQSSSDDLIWRTEVIKENDSCVAGSPVIHHIAIKADKVLVTFCKHSYGEIDLRTGAYHFLGQD